MPSSNEALLALTEQMDELFRGVARMIEQEWLVSTDPAAMLAYLRNGGTGWGGPDGLRHFASERKLRLLSCACLRRYWNLLADARLRRAVEIAERYADGAATITDLDEARSRAEWAWHECHDFEQGCVGDGLGVAAHEIVMSCASNMGGVTSLIVSPPYPKGGTAESTAALLRDIFGNPWRYVMCKPIGSVDESGETIYGNGIDPAWLTWNGGIIPRMAQDMYDRRDFSDMPVLADALEEAGCQDEVCEYCEGAGCIKGEDKRHIPYPATEFWNGRTYGRVSNPILAHCREPGPHVRGCWVVDVILGKE